MTVWSKVDRSPEIEDHLLSNPLAVHVKMFLHIHRSNQWMKGVCQNNFQRRGMVSDLNIGIGLNFLETLYKVIKNLD